MRVQGSIVPRRSGASAPGVEALAAAAIKEQGMGRGLSFD